MGRLFDGIAALTGIKEKASYEGQGAVLLEAEAVKCVEEEEGTYSVSFRREQDSDSVLRFDWAPMTAEILEDISSGTPKCTVAAKFMNTLMHMAVEQCRNAGNSRVVLSGGTFQNMYIMHRLPGMLTAAGFDVYTHRRVSCNDEGISLGQLCVLQYHLESMK